MSATATTILPRPRRRRRRRGRQAPRRSRDRALRRLRRPHRAQAPAGLLPPRPGRACCPRTTGSSAPRTPTTPTTTASATTPARRVEEFSRIEVDRRRLGRLRGQDHLRPGRRGSAGARRAASSAREREIGGDPRLLHYLAVPPAAFGSIVDDARRARPDRRARPGDPREAVRPRLRLGRRPQRDPARRVRRLPDLPDRPLPRQGGGAEHPRAALRQRPLRAALEPQQHRVRPDRRARRRCRSAPAPASTRATGAYRDMVVTHLLQLLSFIAMEPPAALNAKALRAGEGQGHAGVPDDRARRRWCAASTTATAPRTASTPSPTRRRSSRSRSRSTTGAGPASRSTCGPASAWPSPATWSRSTSASRRCGCSRNEVQHQGANQLVFELSEPGSITADFQAKVPGATMELGPARMTFELRAVVLRREPARGLRAADPRRDARRRDPVHQRRGDRAALGDQRRRARAPARSSIPTRRARGDRQQAQELIAPWRWRLPESRRPDRRAS